MEPESKRNKQRQIHCHILSHFLMQNRIVELVLLVCRRTLFLKLAFIIILERVLQSIKPEHLSTELQGPTPAQNGITIEPTASSNAI